IIFNKRKLVTKRRVEILDLLISKHQDNAKGFDSLDLMTDLYSLRWLLHPGGDTQLKVIELFLDSFVHTGDLKRVGQKYALSPHALGTMEDYEEQERRHTANIRVQMLIAVATIAMAITTGYQMYLAKIAKEIEFNQNR